MQRAPEANCVPALCCGDAGQLQAIPWHVPQHLVHLCPACVVMTVQQTQGSKKGRCLPTVCVGAMIQSGIK